MDYKCSWCMATHISQHPKLYSKLIHAVMVPSLTAMGAHRSCSSRSADGHPWCREHTPPGRAAASHSPPYPREAKQAVGGIREVRQSRRRSADASSAACDKCYLVAPRSHSSSVSTFVSPAHSSQADPIRSANATSSKQAVQVRPLVGSSIPVLKLCNHASPVRKSQCEPSSYFQMLGSRIRSAALAPCSIAPSRAIEAIVGQMLRSERNRKPA